MIRSITLKNFKSFQDATLTLAPLTFLIGPNASGKSNALEAMRFASLLARGLRLDDIERELDNDKDKEALIRGTCRDLFNYGNILFGLEIELDNPDLSSSNKLKIDIELFHEHLIIKNEEIPHSKFPLYKVKSQPKDFSDEILVTHNNFARGGRKPEIPCSNKQAVFYQLETPSRYGNKDTGEFIVRILKTFREALKNIIFLDPRPAGMRDYAFPGDNKTISENGSNVSGILYAICQDERKADLLDFIKALPEQDIIDIVFIKTPRNEVMVSLIESFGGQEKQVDAPLLSDGTLRVLAVAGTLLSAPAGATVIIEEIDNGIHPSRAMHLVAKLNEIAKKRKLQVLVSAHNPALLDAVPTNQLGDVLCCFRDPQSGGSKILRLGDLERFPELIAKGSLGKLMTLQILDQALKDTSTSDERVQKALSWLNSFAGVI